eukprot:763303-Hanusia_phi.AAC.6
MAGDAKALGTGCRWTMRIDEQKLQCDLVPPGVDDFHPPVRHHPSDLSDRYHPYVRRRPEF